MNYLDLLLRITHILSAIALLGSGIFFLVVMFPLVKTLDEETRKRIADAAKKRSYRITHPAIMLLVITGFIQFIQNIDSYKNIRGIHGVMGVKILLALAILCIIFAQTFGVIKGCPSKWAKVNVTLGITIVILAGIARGMRLAAG